jgi:transcription initiation factor IIE alpha subunit
MSTTSILQLVKQHGQVRDAEIAQALGLKLDVVHSSLKTLRSQHHITCCDVIRYSEGKPIKETLVRASGYFPPAAPGRKPKTTKAAA